METQANRLKQLINGFNEKKKEIPFESVLIYLKMNLNTSECSH